jgi:F420-dependent oxidoreductase-like protein
VAHLKFGVLPHSQYTDWPSLQRIGQRVDELGYDALWVWDHLYPIVGEWRGPIFEGYLTLAGWACVTGRASLGLMVGANTFRNPALTAKMVTTLDHMSQGRAVLGIGGAWFEREHKAFGIDFGSGFGERLDWLDEAVALMKAMLHDGIGSARGAHYQADEVRNDPRPLQPHLPILIGGEGERKTLATVARYADIWNGGGDVEFLRRKVEVLRRWCQEVGRDESEIERSVGLGAVVIRDDAAQGRRVADGMAERNQGWRGPRRIGSAEQVADWIAPYVELGFTSVLYDAPAPYDEETLERFMIEVKPMLEASVRQPA